MRRIPVAVWVIAAVVAVHVALFWLVEDKCFMPKVGPYSAPPSPPNFGARTTSTIDPATGEKTTETIFVVSTELTSPRPAPSASR